MPLLLAVLMVAWLVDGIAAQTTYFVPNGSNPTNYVSAAAPGDILVLGASHPSFILNKGLNLRPATGRTTITGISTSLTIPTGQHAALDRLDFIQGTVTVPPSGFLITTSGSVALGDCTVSLAALAPSYSIRHLSGSLALTQCRVTATGTASGNPNALVVEGGVCSVVSSRIEGASPLSVLPPPGNPTPAIRLNGGTLTVSSSTLLAGDYAFSPLMSTPALLVVNGTAFVTDSLVQGGSNQATVPGASAIVAQSGTVSYARCTLIAGNGLPLTSGNCAPTPALVGIATSWWFARGATTYVSQHAGSSGQPMVLAFWPSFDVNILPPVVEPLWGNVATGFAAHASVPAPNATVLFPVVVPNVAVLVDYNVSLQALQLDLSNVRASAVVRGLIR